MVAKSDNTNGNGAKKLFPWVIMFVAVAGLLITLSAGFITWGRTENRVTNNEKNIDAITKQVAEGFDKIEKAQGDWRKREAEERGRVNATLQGVQNFLNTLRPTMP